MTAPAAPPEFLRLAGHPLRWALLRALVPGDRQVRELTALVGEPQNLVSYHLKRLRTAGLVAARRSSADGRETYYRVDLDRCRGLLAAAGGALHPALRLRAAVPADPPPGTRVLFLCTGNSARSQMAEALLRHQTGGLVEAYSAGSAPKPLHANAVRAMRERGIDLSRHVSKALSGYEGRSFDAVITLCDKVREVCPDFPGGGLRAHWSMPDPAAAGDDETYPAFEACAEDVAARVGHLRHLLAATAPS